MSMNISGSYRRYSFDGGLANDKVTVNEMRKYGKVKEITNKSSLSKAITSDIQQLAREDAKKGVYMGSEFGTYRKSYMQQHISPNRSKLISMINPWIINSKKTNGRTNLFQIPGFTLYKGEFSVDKLGANVSIYDNNGQLILSYTPPPNGGGWITHQTAAETQWYDITRDIYYSAYVSARNEMKAQERMQVSESTTTSDFNTSA